MAPLHAGCIDPRGLGIANVLPCALLRRWPLVAATCSAIGSAASQCVTRLFGRFAAGIIAAAARSNPATASITMSSTGCGRAIAGRLFLAAIGPALFLWCLFAGYAAGSSGEYARRTTVPRNRHALGDPAADDLSCGQVRAAPARRAVRALLTGVMIALYGAMRRLGDGGAQCVLALGLIASIYSVWTPHDLSDSARDVARVTMLMLIIACRCSFLRDEAISYQPIAAESIVELALSALGTVAASLFVIVLASSCRRSRSSS